mgnify:CR=1 FL=1
MNSLLKWSLNCRNIDIFLSKMSQKNNYKPNVSKIVVYDAVGGEELNRKWKEKE